MQKLSQRRLVIAANLRRSTLEALRALAVPTKADYTELLRNGVGGT